MSLLEIAAGFDREVKSRFLLGLRGSRGSRNALLFLAAEVLLGSVV